MTVEEISDRLDEILSSNHSGIKVTEYTKSLYLTNAQETLVTELLKNYEYTDNLRHLLGELIVEETVNGADITSGQKFSTCTKPNTIKQILYEEINDTIKVIPMDYNDFHETLDNPFRSPNSEIAYRNVFKDKIMLFCSENIFKYYYIYCEIPKPIILENLPDGLEIQGETTKQTSVMHYDAILNIVSLAASMIMSDKIKFIPKPEKAEGDKK